MADLDIGAIVFVRTGLGDGLALAALLDHLALDRAVWERAEASFDERVLDAVEASDHRFLAELDALAETARAEWSIRVRPIDEDLDAWLDLLAALQTTDDPARLLERIRLPATRLARVQRSWSVRMRDDEALRERFEDGLRAPRAEAVEVTIEPPVLDATRRRSRPETSVDETSVPLASRAIAVEVPFEDDDANVEPPPLLTPLPRAPRVAAPAIAVTERTQIARLALDAEPALPFVDPLNETAPLPLRLNLSAELPFTPPPQPKLGLEVHAELTAKLAIDPPRATDTLALHGLTASEKEGEDAAWRRRFEAHPEERERWYAAFVEASQRLRSGR